ncbi:hypothetical protein KO525_06365 [Psychrosphaera sp. B3R10]|uniref:hypothetical protein n=1 Tax=unclassified Psychrosphaera TaxID=2641570 RepID=UPI001C093F47|nr:MULTISPECIES: hypothetical protein [unclassified Psychrosphaera]MBU2882319.1 hypothetical protein [Psychrosphaera sp. I2R16]MBU2989000.1 hypothetical protein [Psychrosphaera sp. B3R10]MDO6718014.1 hypothetical protein [Psychrosphaera sp. 1_MG-2023]
MFKTEHLFVEQLIPFTIRSNKPLESVYLVATNMNMGRLPVRLNKLTKTETQAEVFFGMCAEPMMSWNVILTYQDGTQEITDLKSYWNQRAIQ